MIQRHGSRFVFIKPFAREKHATLRTVYLIRLFGQYVEQHAPNQSREQFGRRLADFQVLRWMMADMAVDLDAARLLIDCAASNGGAALPNAVEASMAKTNAKEMAIRVTHQALQLFGSHGYL